GVAWSAYSLGAAVTGRRARLARELAPLLELFILELGGGGSALSALGSVTLQVDGELAYELRRLLIASNVLGSQPFESRLNDLAAELQIPAIASLATIVAASREYGTSVSPGVRRACRNRRRGPGRRDSGRHRGDRVGRHAAHPVSEPRRSGPKALVPRCDCAAASGLGLRRGPRAVHRGRGRRVRTGPGTACS